MVVSVEEKVSNRHHMWIGKMSESEPYDEASKAKFTGIESVS